MTETQEERFVGSALQTEHPYSYAEFYAASTDKTADIFLCLENQKEYIPCEHELQQYDMKLEKQHDRGKAR